MGFFRRLLGMGSAEQASREDRCRIAREARDEVRRQVAETPYRVTENNDGTWCAWRCYVNTYVGLGVSLDFVQWVKLERAEAAETMEAALQAVERYKACRAVLIHADGTITETEEG